VARLSRVRRAPGSPRRPRGPRGASSARVRGAGKDGRGRAGGEAEGPGGAGAHKPLVAGETVRQGCHGRGANRAECEGGSVEGPGTLAVLSKRLPGVELLSRAEGGFRLRTQVREGGDRPKPDLLLVVLQCLDQLRKRRRASCPMWLN
jgi:hypothetical protein